MTLTETAAIPCTSHIFLIPPPDGRELLPGRCRRCGLVREFKATVNVAFANVFAVKEAS